MNVQIKKFNDLSVEELYQILKIRVDVFMVEQNCLYPELDNKDQDSIHFFISEDDQIASYLRIYFQSESRAAIGRVITHEYFRKKGIGRLLIHKALAYLKGDGKTKSIYLQSQEHLIGFYASFGFNTISDSYLDAGIPHVDMELKLNV